MAGVVGGKVRLRTTDSDNWLPLINDSLLRAQTFTGTATSYQTAHRDVWLGFGGLGFTF